MNINADRYTTPWRNNQRQAYYKGYAKQEKAAADASAEKTQAESASENKSEKTCREQILEKMAEMAKKVKDGTVEPAFQIGSMAYTLKEWDKLLEKFDDAEEALQAEVQAQIEEAEKQAAKEALRRETEGETGTESTKTAALLTDEVTKCSYPTDDPKQKHWFVTAYGADGIFCKEAYFDGTRWVNKDCWKLPFTEAGQYEKVMAFLKRFPSDANLRFAAHENFWKAFLAGEIDEDDFAAFFETAKDGAPDYTYTENGAGKFVNIEYRKTVDNKRCVML